VDGWYLSGDYGFFQERELYVIGRRKDVLIVAGKNIYPEDIEDGRRLNVACLVVTKPSDDGRYLNIARVVSLPKKGGNDGRAN